MAEKVPAGFPLYGSAEDASRLRRVLGRYRALSDAELIFRDQAKTRIAGQRFEQLYRGW